MRTIPGALATHYASDGTSTAIALWIERTDSQVFGFTSHDGDVTIGAVLYKSAPGLVVTNMEHSAGFGVDNLELTTFDDETVFTRLEILGGVWRNAAFSIFRYNWASPGDGIDTLMAGTVGEVSLRRSTVVVELRGLQQYLQQPVGNVSSKTCRVRLGSTLCGVNLASYTVTGSVTSVTSNQVFTDSTKAQAANWFAEGSITWTGGANDGLTQKIKAFASGGIFTLSLPMLATVTIGDTFSVIAGCTKRAAEDCATKFGNILNFQGEPHRPTVDTLVKPAEPSV